MGECKAQGSSDISSMEYPFEWPSGQGIPEKETDIFTLSWHEDLAAGDGTSNHAHNHCFDAEMDTTYTGVKALAYWECHGDFGNQLIKYLPKTQVNQEKYVMIPKLRNDAFNRYVTLLSAIVQTAISSVYCSKRPVSQACQVQ